MLACWASTLAWACTFSTVARICALFHVISLLDVEVGDPAKGGRADIDIGFGFDLAGSVHNGDQVLPDHRAGDHFGVALLLPMDRKGDDSANHENRAQNDQYFFIVHLLRRGPPIVTQFTRISFKQYIIPVSVPAS